MPQQCNWNFFIKLVVIIVLQSTSQVSSEFYSSIDKMSLLVEYENHFVKQMQNFIKENESRLEFLKMRLQEFEVERDEATTIGRNYYDNPVNKYLLTKRLTTDWQRIENLLEYNAGKKFLKTIKDSQNKYLLPNEEDFTGALEGFIRMQDIYRLNTKDLATGVIKDVKYNLELSSRICYDLAKYCFNNGFQKLAHSWLMEALKRLPADKEQTPIGLGNSVSRSDILLTLAELKANMSDIEGARKTFLDVLQLSPENQIVQEKYENFLKKSIEKNETKIEYAEEHWPLPKDMLSTEQHMRYKLTCGGFLQQTPSEERDLRCGYLTETHPFLTLAPIKVEELNHDPLLVVYYDVLSDGEIEILKKLVEYKLERSRVMGLNGSTVSPVRTSQLRFIPKTEHPILAKIDQRVEDMTNLNMESAEDHQFANYGIGGHYAEHHDWFVPEQFDKFVSRGDLGNRIATVLFYLSDVEQGGGTAFPYMKRLLLPKKGSAAFWYNLHASGEGDIRTLHGACPIIVGSKWVQNRWIRERFQDAKRPCEIFDDRVVGFF